MKKNILNFIPIMGIAFMIISGTVDLDKLFNYANQTKPTYIVKDNIPDNNSINNKTATLGRVFFMTKIYLQIILLLVQVVISKKKLLETMLRKV